jgi:hypothetical protein
MINYAQLRKKTTEDKIKELKESAESDIPVEEWDRMYLIIKGTKGLFEEYSWDELLGEVLTETEFDNKVQEIVKARKDNAFREFYQLMKVLDDLKPLLET